MVEKPNNNNATGTVLESLPNAMFKVEMKDGAVVLAHLSGKMRLHHIKVLVGDTVELVMDPYGEKGRIVRRL